MRLYAIASVVMVASMMSISGATPGSFWWNVNKFFEDIHEKITFDTNRKIDLMISHAEERMNEKERALEREDNISAEIAQREFDKKITELESIINSLEEKTKNRLNETGIIDYIIRNKDVNETDVHNNTYLNSSHMAKIHLGIKSNMTSSDVSYIFSQDNTTIQNNFTINSTDIKDISRVISMQTGVPQNKIEELINDTG